MAALRQARIEAKPKRVEIHTEFSDECGIGSNAHLSLEFNELLDRIENGLGLPDEFYRLGIDENKDTLLTLTGIKHLHLGGRGSNTLVYLLETEDAVIILRIAGHSYLEDRPRGARLLKKAGYLHPSLKKPALR